MLLVEKPLPQGSKPLLTHSIWGRRLTVILGSSLKAGDLARARSVSKHDICSAVGQVLPTPTELGKQLPVSFELAVSIKLLQKQ